MRGGGGPPPPASFEQGPRRSEAPARYPAAVRHAARPARPLPLDGPGPSRTRADAWVLHPGRHPGNRAWPRRRPDGPSPKLAARAATAPGRGAGGRCCCWPPTTTPAVLPPGGRCSNLYERGPLAGHRGCRSPQQSWQGLGADEGRAVPDRRDLPTAAIFRAATLPTLIRWLPWRVSGGCWRTAPQASSATPWGDEGNHPRAARLGSPTPDLIRPPGSRPGVLHPPWRRHPSSRSPAPASLPAHPAAPARPREPPPGPRRPNPGRRPHAPRPGPARGRAG